MAPSRSFQLLAYRGRTKDYSVKLYEQDGVTAFTLAVTDVVRFKMSLGTGLPVLDLRSGAATAFGSKVTVTAVSPAEAVVRLAQGDLALLEPGVYDAEVIVVDDSETAPADAAKCVEIGVVCIIPTAGGDLGLT